MEVEIPECMFYFRREMMKCCRNIPISFENSGIDLDTYLQYMGQDKETFKASLREGAEKQVKLSLCSYSSYFC